MNDIYFDVPTSTYYISIDGKLRELYDKNILSYIRNDIVLNGSKIYGGGKINPQSILDDLLSRKEDLAKKIDMGIRVTQKTNGPIAYRINDNEHIEYCGDKITIQKNDLTLFRKIKNQRDIEKPQIPKTITQAYKIIENEFLDNINIQEKDRLIFLTICASYLLPQIQHPIIQLRGSENTGKSTISRITKRIFDDTVSRNGFTGGEYKDVDLRIMCNNNYFLVFDNLSYLSRNQQNLLCVACTGGSDEKRSLYTDNDICVMSFRNCIILNGIEQAVKRSDLISRTRIFEVQQIKKPMSELYIEKINYSKILGAFILLVHEAVKIPIDENLIDTRPYEWNKLSLQICKLLGIENIKFKDELKENKELNQEVIQDDYLYNRLLNIIKGNLNIKIQSETIINMLNVEKINNAMILADKLRLYAPNIKQTEGIEIKQQRTKNGRFWYFETINTNDTGQQTIITGENSQ